MMDRPFRELHELYKILFERAEAMRKKDEQERKEKEEKERRERAMNKQPYRPQPPDVNRTPNESIPTPSPLEAEALEDALEELTEGGVL